MTARLGVQMYTLRDAFEADISTTCQRIADLGIEGIELFRIGEPTRPRADRLAHAEQLRTETARAGLQVMGAHTNLPALDDADWVFEEIQATGATLAICSAPDRVLGFTRDVFSDLTRLQAFAQRLNTIAELAADRGIRIAFHNHWTEWEPVDGVIPFDYFTSLLDPSVALEIDLLWAAVGGRDLAQLVQQNASRVVALHLKDAPGLTVGQPQCAVGEGVVDSAAVVAVAGPDVWHVLENDVVPADEDIWDVVARSVQWFNAERKQA